MHMDRPVYFCAPPVDSVRDFPQSAVDSNTVSDIVSFMTGHWTIHELAEAVNVWCRDRALEPANGQTASELSARTLHFYRSSGLLDAPESGAGRGYGRRHLLQLKAIRLLQAQGLPLSRIQQLLFGRSDEELKQIVGSVGKTVPSGGPCPSPSTSVAGNMDSLSPERPVLHGGARWNASFSGPDRSHPRDLRRLSQSILKTTLTS